MSNTSPDSNVDFYGVVQRDVDDRLAVAMERAPADT